MDKPHNKEESMRGRFKAVLVAALAAASIGAVATTAIAASGPAAPKSTNGNPVQRVASGLMVPTSFAFGDGAVFEGDGGNSSKLPNGGLYVLKDGKAKKVVSALAFVGGLQFHAGVLYVSGASIGATGPQFQILAFKGWNGITFTSQKPIYTAPKGFQAFNGLAFGANGRLYVGVDTGLLNGNDHGPASTSPYLYDILSMNSDGSGLKVFASGIRQPWQMAFPAGSSSPFVSDFGQDSAAKNPPDFLLRVTSGQNYGFPKCNWTKTSNCKGFAKPLKQFVPHTDVGGVVIIGKTLYLSMFGFAAPLRPAAIASLPISGKGSPKLLVDDVPKGYDIIGLGENAGYLYLGVTNQKSGLVYRVKA
jgi:glucose/arabinose dehydrogenase